MASAQAPRPSAPTATATPRALRLLERAEPAALRSPPPPLGWSARLGRWVDRLLVS